MTKFNKSLLTFLFLAGAPASTQADQMQSPGSLNSINGTSSTNATTNNSTTTSTTTTTTVSPLDDDFEGSGDEDDTDTDTEDNTRDDLTSLLSIGSFITRAALFRRSLDSAETNRSPKQYFATCNDRITLPCIVEDFIAVGGGSVPTCTPVHCGNSFGCPPGATTGHCRIESTVTPFAIRVEFGDGTFKGNAEENIGACLRFKQQNCI